MDARFGIESQFEIPLMTEANQDARESRGTRDGHIFSSRGRRMRSNDNQSQSNFTNWFPKGHRFQRSNGNHFHHGSSTQGMSAGVSQLFRRPHVCCQEGRCTENAIQPGSPIDSPSSTKNTGAVVTPVDENTSPVSTDPDRTTKPARFTSRFQHESRTEPETCFECTDGDNTRGSEPTPFWEKRLGLHLPLLSNGRPLEELLQLRNRNQFNPPRFQKPFSNGIRNGASRFVGRLPTFHAADHANQVNQENPASSNDIASPTSRRNFFTTDTPLQLESEINVEPTSSQKISPIRQALARRLMLRRGTGTENGFRRSHSWGSIGCQEKQVEESEQQKKDKEAEAIRRLQKNIQQLQSTLLEMEQKVSDRETELQNMKHETRSRMEKLYRQMDKLQLYQDVEYRQIADTVAENERNFTDLDRQMDYALAVLGSGRRSPGLGSHFKAIFTILKNRMWKASFKVLGIMISVYARVRDTLEDRN